MLGGHVSALTISRHNPLFVDYLSHYDSGFPTPDFIRSFQHKIYSVINYAMGKNIFFIVYVMSCQMDDLEIQVHGMVVSLFKNLVIDTDLIL